MEGLKMFDWDIVFATKLDAVNSAIKASGTTRKTFNYQSKENSLINGAIEGEWHDWEIKSINGAILKVVCPVARGKLKFKEKEYPLDSGIVTIMIEISAFLESDGRTSIREKEGEGVYKVEFKSLGEIENAAAEEFFKNYFRGEKTWLDYIFAVVINNDKAVIPEQQWLKPTSVNIAGAMRNQIGNETGIIAVLTTTEKREAGKTDSIDPQIINYMSESKNYVVAIKAQLVLNNILKKSAQMCGENWKSTDFIYDDSIGYPSLTNNKELAWVKIKTEKGDVKPKIADKHFRIGIIGDRIVMQITDATYEIPCNILGIPLLQVGSFIVKINIEQKFKIELKKEEGKEEREIKVIEDGSKNPTITVTPSQGVETFNTIVDWVGIIAMIVPSGGALLKGGGRMLSRVGATIVVEARLAGAEAAVIRAEVAEWIAQGGLQLAIRGEQAWELGQWIYSNTKWMFAIGAEIGIYKGMKIVSNEKNMIGGVATTDEFLRETVKAVNWTNISEFEPETIEVNNGLIIAGMMKSKV